MFFLKNSLFLLVNLILAIGLTSCIQKQGHPIQELQAKASSMQGHPETLPQGHGISLTSKELYRLNCASCHGEERLGNPPNYPSLIDIKARLSKGEVQEMLEKGRGKMVSFQHLSQRERNAIIAFLFDERPQSVELLTVELGQRIFQSNCASCHRASINDPRPPNVQCCEPAPLAGATKRFTQDEFLRILGTGVCYMPSYTHFTNGEREALYAFIKTLEGKGEPARPTMGEMCPMVRMVAMGGMEHPKEHPGMAMGAKEHPQGQQEHPGMKMEAEEHPQEREEHPKAEKPEVTKETLAKVIKEYIQKEAKMKGGFFLIYDPLAKKTLALNLEKIHEDRLSPLGDGLYFACADFRTPEDTFYDLDFFVKEAESGLEVNEITIHKEAGKARYTWVEEKGIWKRKEISSK